MPQNNDTKFNEITYFAEVRTLEEDVFICQALKNDHLLLPH